MSSYRDHSDYDPEYSYGRAHAEHGTYTSPGERHVNGRLYPARDELPYAFPLPRHSSGSSRSSRASSPPSYTEYDDDIYPSDDSTDHLRERFSRTRGPGAGTYSEFDDIRRPGGGSSRRGSGTYTRRSRDTYDRDYDDIRRPGGGSSRGESGSGGARWVAATSIEEVDEDDAPTHAMLTAPYTYVGTTDPDGSVVATPEEARARRRDESHDYAGRSEGGYAHGERDGYARAESRYEYAREGSRDEYVSPVGRPRYGGRDGPYGESPLNDARSAYDEEDYYPRSGREGYYRHPSPYGAEAEDAYYVPY